MRASPIDDSARITAYTDGPLLVRGDFEIIDEAGETVPVTRATVALCRCGVSSIKPFCDGTHKAINFRTAPVLDDEGTA
jgi:CDGSH-type Zn-finger protein